MSLRNRVSADKFTTRLRRPRSHTNTDAATVLGKGKHSQN